MTIGAKVRDIREYSKTRRSWTYTRKVKYLF